MVDWFTCVILKRCAPLTYQVKTDSGFIWRRQVNQLRAESPDTSNDEKSNRCVTNSEGSHYFQ